jgi:two-component system, sensor histidine kinase LadS
MPASPALYDPATGLAREELLAEHVRMAAARSDRGAPAGALLVVDLGGLALVHTEMGPQVAELVLAELASRVRSAIRRSDSAARLGHDIGVLCNDVQSEAIVEEIAARVLARLTGSPVRVEGRAIWPSVRVGLVMVGAGAAADGVLDAGRAAAGRASSVSRLAW